MHEKRIELCWALIGLSMVFRFWTLVYFRVKHGEIVFLKFKLRRTSTMRLQMDIATFLLDADQARGRFPDMKRYKCITYTIYESIYIALAVPCGKQLIQGHAHCPNIIGRNTIVTSVIWISFWRKEPDSPWHTTWPGHEVSKISYDRYFTQAPRSSSQRCTVFIDVVEGTQVNHNGRTWFSSARRALQHDVGLGGGC